MSRIGSKMVSGMLYFFSHLLRFTRLRNNQKTPMNGVPEKDAEQRGKFYTLRIKLYWYEFTQKRRKSYAQ